MSEHRVHVAWRRSTPDFDYDTYDRTIDVRFEGGQTLQASATAEYKGDPAKANPEELLLSALATCHTLTFLAIAAKSRLVVDAYEDEPVATLGKDAETGRTAITRIVLRPRVTFSGADVGPERLRGLHDKAHRHCFVAASIRSEVHIEPRT